MRTAEFGMRNNTSLKFRTPHSAFRINKKPQPSRGRKLGFWRCKRLPALPRGRIARLMTSRAGFLACGRLLPTPSRTGVQWLRQQKNFSGFELRVSGYEKQKIIVFELETRNAQLGTVSCGFRSAHSCGAAVDLHYLPVPSRAISKNPGKSSKRKL